MIQALHSSDMQTMLFWSILISIVVSGDRKSDRTSKSKSTQLERARAKSEWEKQHMKYCRECHKWMTLLHFVIGNLLKDNYKKKNLMAPLYRTRNTQVNRYYWMNFEIPLVRWCCAHWHLNRIDSIDAWSCGKNRIKFYGLFRSAPFLPIQYILQWTDSIESAC